MDVQAYHDLDAVARDAAGALDRAVRPCLFDRLDWFRLTLAHCPPPGTPLILRAGGTWLFLMRHRGMLRPMASWYTLRFAAVGDCAPDALAAIVRHARRHAAQIELTPLDTSLAAAFRRAGWIVDERETTVNWRTIPADWKSWWAARPKRLRETVRRKGRGDPFRFTIDTSVTSQAWKAYDLVYRRSWKPEEGSPAFLRALAAQEGAAGTLRLGLAWDGDRPVAAQLWLVEDGRATIHKLAYDEADRARSPGTLLTHAMFRHAFAVDRVAAIDFGTGDDAYKADWMDVARPLYRLDAWNPATIAGLAGLARHRAGALVRRLTGR